MAIRRELSAHTPTTDELMLIINNGDLAALGEHTERLGFRDEESLLRFALAVIAQSATRSLTITTSSGSRIALNPSDDLIKPKEE